MVFDKMPSHVVLLSFLIFVFIVSPPSSNASGLHNAFISGGDENGLVASLRRSIVGISEANTSFILAADRTQRKDPLNGFRYYTGGWNIRNQHYWASVGFSAAPVFSIAAIWFLCFGLTLFFIACCYCCFPRRNYSYSPAAYAFSLILLITFTAAVIIGCIVLYNGQSKFHDSTSTTSDFVLRQSNITVAKLRSFSNYLVAAKMVGIDQISLPSDVQGRIDEIVGKVNASANDLASHTSSNSNDIHDVLDSLGLVLIIVAAVMLVLAFLGFLLLLPEIQFLVYILVLAGWILVTGTFILCGIFLLLHNVFTDTCVALDEWVLHPHAHTSLDAVLPCVDAATANEAMKRNKEVIYQLVNSLNSVIMNISNINYPPGSAPLYFNQSGSLVPILCNPYKLDMTNRTCVTGELSFDNAQQVWEGYTCIASVVSGAEICKTVGRITPKMYAQFTTTVNVSNGLYHSGPLLADLSDCTFVRQTFKSISDNNCPGLRHYSERVYIGLLIASVSAMLSLIFLIIYSRERQHREHSKQFSFRSDQTSIQEKALLGSPS
ncbi:uncharacterized protein [Typha latifolia]|uniref:uncharacterized protein n=1 Tax=Typha latifolia TaxID=4733 RepID=UPI003C2C359E